MLNVEKSAPDQETIAPSGEIIGSCIMTGDQEISNIVQEKQLVYIYRDLASGPDLLICYVILAKDFTSVGFSFLILKMFACACVHMISVF